METNEIIKNEIIKSDSKCCNSYKFESDQLDQLYTALAKAQMEMEAAPKAKNNPYYKSNYADLSSIIQASRPSLAKYDLCVLQRIIPNGEGKMYLCTRLGHKSGQWIESKMIINPLKADIQTLGSYLTYIKRYSYAAIVGVATEDDDGEKAMERENKNQSFRDGKIKKEQINILSQYLEKNPSHLKVVLEKYKVSKISDMKEVDFENFMKALNSKNKGNEK